MDAEPPLIEDPAAHEAAAEPPSRWRGWAARLGGVLWVAVCVWALHGLHREWSGFHLADLNEALARIGPAHLALALTCTLLSYLCNAALGILAQRWQGHPTPCWWRDLAVNFITSAFTMNAGGSVIGGGSIRLRLAAEHKLSATDVGKVTMFTGLAGWAGHVLLCGILLCVAAPPLEWLPAVLSKGVGGVLLVVGLLLPFGSRFGLRFWPAPSLAWLTMIISMLDWLLAGLAMWALFPGSLPLSVGSLVAIVVLAQAIAAFTHVPGGVGVLEFTMTKALGAAVAAPVLAGTLVSYRLIYYLLPFAIAIFMLGLRELHRRKEGIAKGGRLALRGWNMIAPRLAALLALGGGFLLLLSANTPMEESRRGLVALLPLPFIEASHFISSLAGALLVVLARGLQRRIQAAWWLAVLAMAGGVIFSLTKGFDWEEGSVLCFMLLCLLSSRAYFHRHAALWTYRFTGGWWLMMLALLGVAVWVGFFTARHVPYQSELWWKFALDGDASRFLRAMTGAGCVFVIVGLAQALRPAKLRQEPLDTDWQAVEKLVNTSDHAAAALAYLGDKRFTFSADNRCGLMYADQGRSRIVMGDPLGDADDADDLLWSFVEQAQDEGMRPVFYQISVAEMPRIVDMGFKLFKLGEEALVDLTTFSLEGSESKKLRQARSRFQRSGLTFTFWDTDTVARSLQVLKGISDAWLAEHRAAEKGFSLGRFEEDYMRRFPCAVVQDGTGRVVAFTNLWPTQDKSELSVDLMRYLPDAPSGVMEAMFIEIMLWGQAEGYRRFNLGMAPLSGLSTHPLAPLWHKLATRIFHRGESFYNFQGLRGYKEKFGPEWEPRYIAVPGTWSLPTALLDATMLIGGGLRKTLGAGNS
jgi:phosphatidylglycerol lysyltransferase